MANVNLKMFKVFQSNGRIGAYKNQRRGQIMPTYMPIKWQDMDIRVRPTGKRMLLPIPYFSGTFLKFILEIKNNSDRVHSFNYSGLLFRLSGVTHQSADTLISVSGLVEIGEKSKRKFILETVHLPQPGNYSFELVLNDSYSDKRTQKQVASFDALPKDATIFNIYMVIISALVGAVIGGLVGFIGGLIVN
jgi:hypothetical protein